MFGAQTLLRSLEQSSPKDFFIWHQAAYSLTILTGIWEASAAHLNKERK